MNLNVLDPSGFQNVGMDCIWEAFLKIFDYLHL